jgi:outer membrane protein
MKIIKIIGLTLLLGQSRSLISQKETGIISLSFKEAINHAMEHNPELKKAKIDLNISRETVKQTVAIGLPQVNVTGGYQQYERIPGNWIKNFAPSPGAPEYIFLQFQQKINSSGTLGINQLLFDGSYLVGLKASREFVDMSKFLQAKTEYDVQVNVSKSYLMVASTQLNIDLIDQNIKVLEKSTSDVTSLYKEGFAEELDYKRLQLSLSQLQLQKQRLQQAVVSLKNILKIQLGIDIQQEIVLTDNIETIDQGLRMVESSELQSWSPKLRPEYHVLNQSIKLGNLDKRRYQMGYLPRFIGFYQHQQMTMRPEFNFFKENLTPNNNWIPSDLFGLQVQWTLFDGLNTRSKIKEVQYKIDKAQVDLTSFEQASAMEWKNALEAYRVQLDQAAMQKENLDLATDIYQKTQLKFKEGVGSTLEILQAETELKNAQLGYLNAVHDLVIAKIEYYKSIGKTIN